VQDSWWRVPGAISQYVGTTTNLENDVFQKKMKNDTSACPRLASAARPRTSGVITYPDGKKEVDAKPNALTDEGRIVRDLRILMHFDDDPRHVESIPGIGVLFAPDIPASITARIILPTAPDWETVREFLTTPGMSERRAIRSERVLK
jgi:hypothetical protein